MMILFLTPTMKEVENKKRKPHRNEAQEKYHKKKQLKIFSTFLFISTLEFVEHWQNHGPNLQVMLCTGP